MIETIGKDVCPRGWAGYGVAAALLAAGLPILGWWRWQSSTLVHTML